MEDFHQTRALSLSIENDHKRETTEETFSNGNGPQFSIYTNQTERDTMILEDDELLCVN